MTRARIAMVLNSPGFGGVTEVVYQLLRLLPSDRFVRHLFFLKGRDEQRDGRLPQLDRFAELGIEIGTASSRDGKIGAIAGLASWIGTHRIDLVHTHSYRPNLYGRMAAVLHRPAGIRVVAHYHNHYDDKWTADGASLPLEMALSASTDAMIAVSSEVGDHVARHIGVPRNRIDVIRNGVDLGRFTPRDLASARDMLGLDREAIIVGLVGRVCEQKGHEDLVEAALRLAPAMQRLQFVSFGDIEDRTLHGALAERIRSAGAATSFTFAGHLSDVPLAFAAVDIVAVPSRWEGYPLVVAEAMASGRAIVATDVSAIPEMTGNGEAAILVPPRQPAALAEGIRRLIGDVTLRERMSARGIALSRPMTWDSAAESVAAVYDRVLRPSGRERQCA